MVKIKDAIILCVITLCSGLLLGGVYGLTKDTIAEQIAAAKIESYKLVCPDAEAFVEQSDVVEKSEELLAASGLDFGNVFFSEFSEATDAGGAVVGYVTSVTSKDGYGGNINIAVGISADGTVNGIDYLTINETAGLGMKATEDKFKSQFDNKKVESFVLTKTGASAENEIDALSGATYTSAAVTNAVNAAIYLVSCVQ